jgi:RNA-binding protein
MGNLRGGAMTTPSPISPTSPRKRALMPTSPLRRALRGHGHALQPLVQVGKGGVTRGLLAQLAQLLFDHELVKVRIAGECPVDRFAVADELGAQAGTNVVQIVGRTVLVYKRHPEKPRFEGKAARDRAAEGAAEPAPERAAKRPPKRAAKRGTKRAAK